MTTDTDALRDDLAFLRGLVEGGDGWQRVFGEGYFAAGLVYGGEMVLHAAQVFGRLPSSGLWGISIGLGPTLVFLAILSWILYRRRGVRPSAMGRALGATFGAAGFANLGLVAVIGAVAWREGSLTVWLIYPCAVLVLQGAAWLVAFALRRRGWMGLVAAGWFAAGIAMALNVQSLGYYILYAGLAFLACMALPGWLMMRGTRASSPLTA